MQLMTIFEEAYREQPGLKIIQVMGFGAKIFLHILVVILASCCVKAEEEKWETKTKLRERSRKSVEQD